MFWWFIWCVPRHSIRIMCYAYDHIRCSIFADWWRLRLMLFHVVIAFSRLTWTTWCCRGVVNVCTWWWWVSYVYIMILIVCFILFIVFCISIPPPSSHLHTHTLTYRSSSKTHSISCCHRWSSCSLYFIWDPYFTITLSVFIPWWNPQTCSPWLIPWCTIFVWERIDWFCTDIFRYWRRWGWDWVYMMVCDCWSRMRVGGR